MQTKTIANEWHIEKFFKPWWVVRDSNGDIVVEVLDSLDNARLIAAAPQLLAECLRAEGELCSALQVSSSEHMTVDMMRAWLKGVRSAIAKATGEQLSNL